MTVSVDVSQRLGDFELYARFDSAGRLTALFGPSGSGKTSLINIIAGLVRPLKGHVAVDGHVLVDTEKGIFVPVHRRRIGMVFQDARLFPHLSVAHNLRYGRWFTPAAERYAKMDAVVELLGIGHLLERRPSHLSGGEKQRVAIGRALLASPKLLLMDEPLAALDDARKAEILPYIERLRDETKIPIVYVSHSVAEVARLASDVAVLAGGRVTAFGPTAEIMQRLDILPANERGEGGALLEMTVASHDERWRGGAGAPAHPRPRRDGGYRAAARPVRAQRAGGQGDGARSGRGGDGRRQDRLQRRARAGAHHRAILPDAGAAAGAGGVRRHQDGELRRCQSRRRPCRRAARRGASLAVRGKQWMA